MHEGILTALTAIEDATGEIDVTAVGRKVFASRSWRVLTRVHISIKTGCNSIKTGRDRPVSKWRASVKHGHPG